MYSINNGKTHSKKCGVRPIITSTIADKITNLKNENKTQDSRFFQILKDIRVIYAIKNARPLSGSEKIQLEESWTVLMQKLLEFGNDSILESISYCLAENRPEEEMQ